MRSRVVKSLERSHVVVTLKTGDTFDGVLYDFDTVAMTLRNCSAVGFNEDKTNAPVDGELLILLADVAFVQRP